MDIPIAGWLPTERVVAGGGDPGEPASTMPAKDGPNKIPTPTKPPTRASQIIGLGLGAIPVAQPSSTI